MIAKDRVWMRRDSIYTQAYDEQQIKVRMNWRNPQGTGQCVKCEHYIQPTIVTQKV